GRHERTSGQRTRRAVLRRLRPARVHGVRRWRPLGRPAARAAHAAPDARPAGARARGGRFPRRHAGPAGARPFRPSGGPQGVLDDRVGRAGDRAARPPRRRGRGRRRHVARRERQPRGRCDRPRARPGAAARDAGARQRRGGRDHRLRAAALHGPVLPSGRAAARRDRAVGAAGDGGVLGRHRPRHPRPATRLDGRGHPRDLLRPGGAVEPAATPDRGAGAGHRSPARPDPPRRRRADGRRGDAERPPPRRLQHPGVAVPSRPPEPGGPRLRHRGLGRRRSAGPAGL
ncbi:MAG: Hydrolase, alpha/beta fold family, partial [uncultured Nocardioidaceae bacterium]